MVARGPGIEAWHSGPLWAGGQDVTRLSHTPSLSQFLGSIRREHTIS